MKEIMSTVEDYIKGWAAAEAKHAGGAVHEQLEAEAFSWQRYNPNEYGPYFVNGWLDFVDHLVYGSKHGNE